MAEAWMTGAVLLIVELLTVVLGAVSWLLGEEKGSDSQ